MEDVTGCVVVKVSIYTDHLQYAELGGAIMNKKHFVSVGSLFYMK